VGTQDGFKVYSVALVGCGVGGREEALGVCFVGAVVAVGGVAVLGYVLGSCSVESEGLKGSWLEDCGEDFSPLRIFTLLVGLVGEELVDCGFRWEWFGSLDLSAFEGLDVVVAAVAWTSEESEGAAYPSATYAKSTPTSVNQSNQTSSFSVRTPNPTEYFLPYSWRTCRSRSRDGFEDADK
jgi:hypothetical protein